MAPPAGEDDRSPADGLERTATFGARASTLSTRFQAGERVAGRYSIVRFLAQGGMGEVYEAIDEELHERVALKTLRSELPGDEQARARFRREIQLARKVTHRNVCRIFDLGSDGDTVFLTMELLAGVTLGDRLARDERMRLPEALPILEQIAAALEAAHHAGVVHGDLKPSNVMLVDGGRGATRVVITDFGLARGRSPHDAGLPASGAVVGTPAYMAPEQVADEEVGAAADLYALGVVMYRMATGVLPFVADTAQATAALRLTGAPRPPRELAPDLDPRWEAAIARCLRREPAARFAHARDVVAALGPRARPRWPWLGVPLAAAFAVAVATLGGEGGRPPPASSARPAVAVLGFKNLSGEVSSAWLAGALAEMLTTELAAADRVRAIGGDAVARVKRELDLGDEPSLSVETASRLRERLGADYLLVGSYLSAGARVRIDVRLQDATGQTVAVAGDSGHQDELVEIVSRTGATLRSRLGMAALTAAEERASRASLPSNAQAARLYSEGLAKLRIYDGRAAVALLQRAIAVEPWYPLAHAALAEAWFFLGFEPEARAAARRARELAAHLSSKERQLVEARSWETDGDPARAAEIYVRLSREHPDDHELSFAHLRATRLRGDVAAIRAALEAVRALPHVEDDPRFLVTVKDLAVRDADFAVAQVAAARLVALGRRQGLLALVLQGETTRMWIRWLLGDVDGAAVSAAETVAIAGVVGDRNALQGALGMQGALLVDRGALVEAEQTFKAIDAPPTDVRGMFVWKLGWLAVVALQRGELAQAEERLWLARDACHAPACTSWHRAWQRLQLGRVAYERGELARSRELIEQAVSGFREVEAAAELGYALAALAVVARDRGVRAEARAHLGEALAIWKKRGAVLEVARTRLALARLELDDGRSEIAAAWAASAIPAFAALPDDRALAEALLGEAFLGAGRLDAAAAAAARATALLASTENLLVRLDVELSRARIAGDAAGAAAVRARAELAGLTSRARAAQRVAGELGRAPISRRGIEKARPSHPRGR